MLLEYISYPKTKIQLLRLEGDIGIRNTHIMNKLETLPSRWLLNKYCKQGAPWFFKNASKASWLWNNIITNESLIDDNLTSKVGIGSNISIYDRFWWIPTNGLGDITYVSNLRDNCHLGRNNLLVEYIYIYQ